MTDLITCPTCGLKYDPSDLSNVVAHEHQIELIMEKGKYMGERVPLNESKARFTSLYYGQKVHCYEDREMLFHVNPLYYKEGWFLLLFNIEHITDEQKIQVAKLSGVDYKAALDRAISFDTALPDKTERDFLLRTYQFYIKQSDLNYKAYQYLISQSYTLDWYCPELNRVITVEEQIELGWVKLVKK